MRINDAILGILPGKFSEKATRIIGDDGNHLFSRV
jgi:hypothetical protein